MFRIINISIFIVLLSNSVFSQEDKKSIREGNKLYKEGKFTEAEKSYQKSLDKNKGSFKGNFNLGDSYYKQGKFSDAANQFKMLTDKTNNKDSLSRIYHNLGNSLLQGKQYEESINAYKNALKNNPKDEDSRYNLSYAMSMLKQQQQQQKKNDDKKDQDNKDDKKQDKKQEQNKDQEKKDQEKKQQEEQQKQEISKENANRLLDALKNDEKKVQQKLKKQKGKAESKEIEKDW